MATLDPRARAVLDYWFGTSGDLAAELRDELPRWFNGGEAIDAEIDQRFGADIDAARAGGLDGWAETAQGRLALLILIDQFSRNRYRGRGEAFSADGHAQRLCLEGLRRGHDRELRPSQRLFFYLPLEHAENVSLQQMCVALFAAMTDEVEESMRKPFHGFHDYAERHREIILRFGRFPHRNAALGRKSTREEAEYLAQPGSGF